MTNRSVPSLPLLSIEELGLLRSAPYDAPRIVRGARRVEIAEALIEADLLQRDPTTSILIVRMTEEGIRVAKPLSKLSTMRFVAGVLDAVAEDPEEAASLERALWQRVLVESALGYVANGVAEIALRTLRYDFRRG